MDWAEFEQRRASGFRTARHGYDKRDVDGFLEAVAAWLDADAAGELADLVVQRKLEQVGQSTARILLIAEQEAEELRRRTEEECAALKADAQTEADQAAARILEDAEEQAEELRRETDAECADLRAEADTVANETCSRAERYATQVRTKADADARQMLDDAAVQARRALLQETERQRAQIDALVAELDRRRNAAVDEVERLRADLLAAIAPHSSRIDPSEREGGAAGRRHVPTYGPSKHANA